MEQIKKDTYYLWSHFFVAWLIWPWARQIVPNILDETPLPTYAKIFIMAWWISIILFAAGIIAAIVITLIYGVLFW